MSARRLAKNILTMSDSSARPKLQRGLELIGGRYALSPALLLGSAPLLIFGFVATEVSEATSERWWAYALVALVGQIVMAVLFGLASLLPVFSPQRTTPWPLVLALYVVVGEVRMLAMVAGLDALELSNEVPLWSRAITSALLIPLAYGASSYALEALWVYRERRAELITSLVSAAAELERQRAATSLLREPLLDDVGEEISEVNRDTSEALGRLRVQVAQGFDVRPELRELLDQSDRRWRRISHDTWERARITIPRPTLAEFLDILARSKPLALWALALSGLFLFALALGRSLNFAPATFWTLVWLVVVLSLGWAVNELSSRVRKGELLAAAGGLVLLLASGIWFYAIPGLSDPEAGAAFAIHITNVISGLIIGFAPSLLRNQQLVLEAIQRRIDESTIERLRVESELQVIAQQVASRLHGNARGEFLARVLTLQRALDQDDINQALEALDALQASLEGIGPESAEPSDEDLLTFLDNWRGFVDITHTLPGVSVPDEIHPAVNTIVMDAVNNAIRHGGADWIHISLEPQGGQWQLRVVNNGKTPNVSSTPGVGTKVLERYAPGAWTLSPGSENQTVLEVTLAVGSGPNRLH